MTSPDTLETTVRADIAAAERPNRPIRRMLRRTRAWIDRHPRLKAAYRTGVGVVGGTLAIVGLLLVPLPGPGWLVVFLGLAVLGTEFHWARRTAAWLKRMLERFWTWWRARRARRAAARTQAQSESQRRHDPAATAG
ncbi:TIGR02611 family protein [Microbacterium cremeum]|uniref:TIGR02611 family protein n=1 Tax=Microbacterium cremeum TaxID=2782169 RepID=UPI001886C511|nr:TIGR02611 family protein [Microbacterium cremeum]